MRSVLASEYLGLEYEHESSVRNWTAEIHLHNHKAATFLWWWKQGGQREQKLRNADYTIANLPVRQVFH